MEIRASYARDEIDNYLNGEWGAITAATVDYRLQTKNWDNWMELFLYTQWDPFLQDSSTTIQQHPILSFSARNSRSYYNWGRQVGAQTPETALRHVVQTIVLPVYSDPRRSYGSTDINLPVYYFLKSYKTDNPVPKPHLEPPIRNIQVLT